MIWKILLGIARLVFWIVLAWIVIGRAGKRGSARVLGDGRIEFAQNRLAFWAWPLIIVLLAWTALKELIQSHGEPLQLVAGVGLGLGTLSLIFLLPGTVVVTAEGLEQIYWFWKNKRICWENIVEIETGQKDRTVTMIGADGTKIVHSRQMVDRPRFLLELKQHCGEELPPDFPREPIDGME